MNPSPSRNSTPTPLPLPYAQAVFFACLVMVMYEILFPRILRFLRVMENPLEIIPITFVGLAIGGVIVLWRNRLENIRLFAFLLPVAIFTCFISFYLTADKIILVTLLVLPYVAVGVILAQSFASFGCHAVYIADLLGAGCGITAAVLLLPLIGAESLMLGTIALGGVSLAWLVSSKREKIVSSLFALLFIFLSLINSYTDIGNLVWWAPDSSWSDTLKPILGSNRVQEKENARLYLSRWGLIARVDVIGEEAEPIPGPLWRKKSGPGKISYPEVTGLALHLDNTRGTSVSRQAPDDLRTEEGALKHLVIGVGGGVDILTSLWEGAGEITAVEINPQIVDIMKNELSPASQGLYQRADVRVMDGRTFLRFDTGQYDRIKMSFTDTYQTFPGSNVFVENYLYTREAVKELFNRVTERGKIRIGKPVHLLGKPEMLRVLATVYEGMKEMGIENPERHIILMGWNMGELAREKLGFIGGMMSLSKTPFTTGEIERERQVFGVPHEVLWRPDRGWVYKGDEASDGMEGGVFFEKNIGLYKGFFEASDKKTYLAGLEKDFSPTTDDRPFFYDFERGHVTSGKILIRLLIIIFAVVVLPVILYAVKKIERGPVSWAVPIVFFSLLGLAYSLLQISFIQKFTVFLGGPIYSLMVILLSLLYFGALGAYISKRTGFRFAVASVLVVLVMGVFYEIYLETIFRAVFSESASERMLYGFILLAPISIAMGVPFPYYLRRVKERLGGSLIPVMYSADSAFLVIGSTGVLYLAPVLGFQSIFFMGLLIYLMAGMILMFHNLSR